MRIWPLTRGAMVGRFALYSFGLTLCIVGIGQLIASDRYRALLSLFLVILASCLAWSDPPRFAFYISIFAPIMYLLPIHERLNFLEFSLLYLVLIYLGKSVHRSNSRISPWVWVPYVLFLLLQVLTLPYTNIDSPTRGLKTFLVAASWPFFLMVFSQGVERNPHTVGKWFQYLLVFSVVVIAYGYWDSLFGPGYFVVEKSLYSEQLRTVETPLKRNSSFLSYSTTFGHYLAFVMVIALWRILVSKERSRTVSFVVLISGLPMLLTNVTRAAWFEFSAGSCLLLLWRRKYVLLILSALVAVYMASEVPFIQTRLHSRSLYTFSGRIYMWQAVWQVAARNVLPMVGFGSFGYVHSTYMRILGETGILGLSFYLLFCVGGIYVISKVRTEYRIPFLALWIVMLIAGISESTTQLYEINILGWSVIAMANGLTGVSEHTREESK